MKSTILIRELREKDSKTLIKELHETNKKIAETSFQAHLRKIKNYKEINVLRKKAARIWTILAEKAIQELEKEENAK